MVTSATAELSPVSPSGVADDAVAVFRTVPGAAPERAIAPTVMTTDAPGASAGIGHRVLLGSIVQAPGGSEVAVAERGSIRGSSTLSSITTDVAVEGPSLMTVIVYVSEPPGGTVAGETDLVTVRSASRVTSVVAAALLSVGSASAVDDDTRATSPRDAAVDPGGTVPRTVIVAVAPAASVPSGQFNVWAVTTHGAPCDDVAVTLTSGGTSSTATTSLAGLGPSLRTVIVEVTTSPATTVAGVFVLLTARSAEGTTAMAAARVENVRSCSSARVAPS